MKPYISSRYFALQPRAQCVDASRTSPFISLRRGLRALLLCCFGLALNANARNIATWELFANGPFAPAAAVATTAGHTAVTLAALANITSTPGLNELWLFNQDNSSFPNLGATQIAALNTFVTGGGTILFFDRFVTGANLVVPGASGISFIRDLTAPAANQLDLDPAAPASLVAGLNNASFDGGNFSSHGYMPRSSLPSGAVPIMFREASNTQVVATVYQVGSGAMFYYGVPADFYLTNQTFRPVITASIKTLLTNSANGAVINAVSSGFTPVVSKFTNTPPGVVDGATYNYFYDAAINNANRIIFSAALSGGSGLAADQGVFSQGASGTLALVLRAGDAIDGVQTVGRNMLFPRYSDNGRGIFQADAAGAGPIIYTQWVDDGTADVSLFAKRTTVFASVPSNSAFAGLTYTSQNQSTGEGYFAARLVNGGAGVGAVTPANDSAVWKVVADGTVTAVASEGEALPVEMGTGLSQSDIQRVAMGAGATGVYRGLISGTGVTGANSVAVLKRNFNTAAAPVQVVRTDTQAAGLTAGAKYYDILGETVNTGGSTLFWASLTGTGVTGANDRALFSDRTGSLAKVIQYGDDLSASVGAGLTLASINTYWLIDNGVVVLQGTVGGAGVTINNDAVVLAVSTAGVISKLVREGDVAAAIGGSTIDLLHRVDVSTNGKIAVLASTLNGTGDSAGNLNNQGLLIGDVATPGTYSLALRKGSIVPGGTKRIWSISMSQQTVQGSSGSTAGMSRTVNNNGKVVAMLVLYDNDQGVFTGP